jgi:hypothetical protein
MCSRWHLCVGQRKAPAGEITKSGRVAEYLDRSIPDLDGYCSSFDGSNDPGLRALAFDVAMAALGANGPEDEDLDWDAIVWPVHEEFVRRYGAGSSRRRRRRTWLRSGTCRYA